MPLSIDGVKHFFSNKENVVQNNLTSSTTLVNQNPVVTNLADSIEVNPNSNNSLMEKIQEKTIVSSSTNIFPSLSNMIYGMNEKNSINVRSPFGVVSQTKYKTGIKFVSNSGIVMWEQYIADHPQLKTRNERFTMTVEAVTYASDQNAFIVACRVSNANLPMFFLIAYDASTGEPICDEDEINPTPTIVNNSGMNNPISNRLSLAYNPISQTVICYSTIQANLAAREFKIFSFDRYTPSKPFSARTQSTFLNWTYGAAPNFVSNRDYLIDLAIDNETGLIFGMFQTTNTASGKSVYVVPFNDRFSSIRRATGSFIPDINVTWSGTPSLISPNYIYRTDQNNLVNGIWYGFYVWEDNGRKKIYNYAIQLNTDDISMPSVISTKASLEAEFNGDVSIAYDEYGPNLVYATVRNSNLTNTFIQYNGQNVAIKKNINSGSIWDPNNFNVTFTNEDAQNTKLVNSTVSYYEQWDGDATTTKVFTPTPMINIRYRSQELGYSDSGSALFPSQLNDDILFSYADALLSDNENTQGSVPGNGLWAIFKRNNSNVILSDEMNVENVSKLDNMGTIQFDINIPYTVNGKKYVTKIPEIIIGGFKKISSATAIIENSIDVNRFNYDLNVIDQNDTKLFREKRPNNINLEQIKKMIYSLVIEKPVGFSIDNILLDENSFVYNYLNGTITIPKVNVDYWYDRNGNLNHSQNLLAQNFLLEGFYQASETTFDENTPFIAIKNTTIEEFLNNKAIFDIYIYTHLVNVPIEYDIQADYQFDKTIGQNLIIDNANGKLTIKEFYLKKWNDAEGKLHTDLSKPYEIVINNFMNLTDKTSVRNNYLVYRPQYQPTDIDKQEIIEIIKEITFNAPLNFSTDNISLKDEPIYDNINGTITVYPIFNNTFDENGFLNLNPIEMGEVVLRGYKATNKTTPSDNWDIGGYRKYASDYITEDNLDSLKKLISANIFNLPTYHFDETKDFKYLDDIIIDRNDIIINNIEGSIELTYKIKKYYDEQGIYHDDDLFPVQKITITGFKRIHGPTNFEPLYQLAYTNISPEKITDVNLQDILLWYGENLYYDLKRADISFAKIERIPSEGIIKLVPILDKYYDDFGNPQFTSKLFSEIVITGFKKIQPTTFDENRWILGTSNLVAQEVANDTNALKALLMKKIINPPPGFKENNINILNTPYYSNREGKISVIVKLTKYYDENGFLKNDDNSPAFTLVISGFFVAYSRTDIPTVIDVHMPNKTPQDLSVNDIKSVLIDNFSNLPPTFTNNNIILSKDDYEFSNIDGVLIIRRPVINYYFDQNLGIQYDQKSFPAITLKGFKKIEPTYLPITDWNIGDNTIVASEFIKNTDNVKYLIASRIENVPIDFDPITDITLSNWQVENQLGSFKVSVRLNKYYDNNGMLATYGWGTQEIIILGFAIVFGETSFASEIDSYMPTIAASSITKDEIQKILFNAINNAAPNTKDSDIIFEMDDIIIDNVNGTISVEPTLESWFDNKKMLQNVTKKFPSVKITGFAKVRSTIIMNNWNLGNSQITPEEAIANRDTILGLIDNNILNKPDNFNPNVNIEITQLTPNNLTGVLTVKFVLNKYYDENGVLQTTNFEEYTANITGYKYITSTVIPTYGWSIGDVNKLASDFIDEKNQDYIKEIVYNRILNLPIGFDYINNLVLSNVKSNNTKGELEFDLKVKGGYGIDGNIDLDGDSINLNAHIVIGGFMPKLGTIINNSVNIPNYKDTISSTLINNEQALKNIIYQNRFFIFNNYPANFSIDDIVNVEIINANNKKGFITLKLSIKNYYEKNNGNLINDQNSLLSETITIFGFLETESTIFKNENSILIQSLGNYDAFDFNANKEELLQKWSPIIFDNKYKFFDNLPPDFSINNIVSIDVSDEDINNINGSCMISIGINRYFDNDNEATLKTTPIVYKFMVNGFRKSISTTYNKEFLLKNLNSNSVPILAQNILASDLYYNQLTNVSIDAIVRENYQKLFINLPDNFNVNNITNIKCLHYDNLEGTIDVQISIVNYYNDVGIIENTKPLDVIIKLMGFKKVVPTINDQSYIISPLSDLLASSLTADDIVQLLYDHKELIFKNTLPFCTFDEFKRFIKINHFNTSNAESKLDVNLSLGIYYNDAGVLIKDLAQSKILNLTIYGFKQNQNKTIIRESLKLNNYTNVLATNAQNDLQNIIVTYQEMLFANPPINLSINDFILSDIRADNFNGTIEFNIALNSYYNENGILIDSNSPNFLPLTKRVIFSGFQQVVPTSIGSTNIGLQTNLVASIGDPIFNPSYYASLDLKDAERQLEDLVRSKIFVGSINGNVNNQLIMSDFKFDPVTANDDTNSLVVSFKLSNYYTLEEGLVSEPKEFILTINGFGLFKENTLSKDTIYYMIIIAIIYLSLLCLAIGAYVIYRVIRWKKGKM